MEKNGLSSFLLVLGAGLAIGLLFAPKSGQETRQLLKDKADEGAEYLKQRGGELKETAAEWVEKGKETLNKQKENLSDALEAGKQAYYETVNQPEEPPVEGAGL